MRPLPVNNSVGPKRKREQEKTVKVKEDDLRQALAQMRMRGPVRGTGRG